MAQKAKPEEVSLSDDEARELEKLLEDEGVKTDTAPVGGKRNLLRQVLALFRDRRKLLMIGGAAVLLLLVVGVTLYFVTGKTEEKPEEAVAPAGPAKGEAETAKIQKVNMFKLEPFFIPLAQGTEETGEFAVITPYLLLSNNKLDKEIEKNLYLVRKNIYTILRAKRPDDFKADRVKTEERLKREIVTAANTLLLSGTGSITGVYFTQFVVK